SRGAPLPVKHRARRIDVDREHQKRKQECDGKKTDGGHDDVDTSLDDTDPKRNPMRRVIVRSGPSLVECEVNGEGQHGHGRIVFEKSKKQTAASALASD